MSKAFTVDELVKGSADFQRLNAGVMGKTPAPVMQERDPKKAVQIIEARTRLDRCNKTEMRFYWEWLEEKDGFGNVVIVQPPRFFELQGGGTYTPDFVEVRPSGVVVWEVKGGYKGPGWEQGIERYKRAALQYNNNYITFRMAKWDRKKMTWTISSWK